MAVTTLNISLASQSDFFFFSQSEVFTVEPLETVPSNLRKKAELSFVEKVRLAISATPEAKAEGSQV